MQKFINHPINEIKSHVINRDSWGSYIILDDFIDETLFQKLSTSFSVCKQKDIESSIGNNILNRFKSIVAHVPLLRRIGIYNFSNNSIFTLTEPPRMWRDDEEKGSNLVIGGSGKGIEKFNKLFELSEAWEEFIHFIYSPQAYRYFHDIFSDTFVYKNNISSSDIKDSVITCKLSSQLNNYGDIIHPDARQKVISYLIYLDNKDWNQDSIGGTNLWEVLDHEIEYDRNKNSMDYKSRNGRFSSQPTSERLTKDEAERIRRFQEIDFKPNRLVGFVRNDKSYHSIPPRVLPYGVSRDCLQINIWNFKSRKK